MCQSSSAWAACGAASTSSRANAAMEAQERCACMMRVRAGLPALRLGWMEAAQSGLCGGSCMKSALEGGPAHIPQV